MFACYGKACAPPPVGTGGSNSKGGGRVAKPSRSGGGGGAANNRFMGKSSAGGAGKKVSIGGGRSIKFPSKRPITSEKIREDIDGIKMSKSRDMDVHESEYENTSYEVESALLKQFKRPSAETRRIIADIAHIEGMKAARAAGHEG